MRRIVFIFATLLMCGSLSAQSMKMVVDSKGDIVGRYVKTNADKLSRATSLGAVRLI